MTPDTGYTYSVEQCDISDKPKAERFRSKRTAWLEQLSGTDHHSIFGQIYSTLWDYALFCAINELRKLASDPPPGVGFNGPVLRLFDAGFATTQASAIRRLIEKPKTRPRLAVVSLRAILDDIRENLGIFTRENYVCHDGLPYDYETVRQEWQANLDLVPGQVQSGSLDTSGPRAWHTSELRHRSFDKVAQVESKKQSRVDLIQNELIDFLGGELKKCDDVKTYVDKFIAHAAAPDTRSQLTDSQRGLTLNRLSACHKVLYRVASFVSGHLLCHSPLGGIPEPQFDHLANLDKSWATNHGLEVARKKWYELSDSVRNWNSVPLWPPLATSDSIDDA